MTTKKQNYTIIITRVALRLKKLIEEFINQNYHINKSDFFRDALREKIKPEAPELYTAFSKKTRSQITGKPNDRNSKSRSL